MRVERVERGGEGEGDSRAVGRFLRLMVFFLVVCFLVFLPRLRVRGAEAERFLVGFAAVVFFRLVVGVVFLLFTMEQIQTEMSLPVACVPPQPGVLSSLTYN